MKSRGIFALLIIIVIAACVAMFFQTFKREWTTETTPATGEARYNRFFALQNVLKSMGQPTSSSVLLYKILPELDAGDTVVIGDDIGRIKPDDAVNLAEWVREGGHLVFSPTAYAKHDVPLLDELGLLSTQESKPTCVALAGNADKDPMRICGSGFHLTRQALAHAQVLLGDNADKGLVFARVAEGDGTVSMLSNLGVLADNSLKKPAQQAFAWRLLAPNFGRGRAGRQFVLDQPVRARLACVACVVVARRWLDAYAQRAPRSAGAGARGASARLAGTYPGRRRIPVSSRWRAQPASTGVRGLARTPASARPGQRYAQA